MIRTFIALEPVQNQKKLMMAYLEKGKTLYSKGITWSKPENLHLTVQFIGDTKEEDLDHICQFLNDQTQDLSVIKLSDLQVEWFPAENSRTVWLQYEKADRQLYQLHKSLKEYLANAGYQTDNRKLLCHITLGRVKEWFSGEKKIWQREMLIPAETILLDRLVFYQSRLTPNGPVYTKINEYRLKGGNDVNGER